jgi:hypothetical protein
VSVDKKHSSLHVAILMVALVTANLQCSATCGWAPRDGSHTLAVRSDTRLPPRHRHSPARNNLPGCMHSLFLDEAGSVVATPNAPTVTGEFLVLRTINTAFLARASKIVAQETSPPGLADSTFSSVLQI